MVQSWILRFFHFSLEKFFIRFDVRHDLYCIEAPHGVWRTRFFGRMNLTFSQQVPQPLLSTKQLYRQRPGKLYASQPSKQTSKADIALQSPEAICVSYRIPVIVSDTDNSIPKPFSLSSGTLQFFPRALHTIYNTSS